MNLTYHLINGGSLEIARTVRFFISPEFCPVDSIQVFEIIDFKANTPWSFF